VRPHTPEPLSPIIDSSCDLADEHPAVAPPADAAKTHLLRDASKLLRPSIVPVPSK